MTDATPEPNANRHASVREGYSQVAEQGFLAATESEAPAAEEASGCCAPSAEPSTGGGCCGPTMAPDELAAKIGYDPEELAQLPGGTNLGLSCGNPAAIASLAPGQTVLDLGSGAGFDAFLCGPKVGASGRVIGVDMTPAMLDRARTNIAAYRERTGLDNIEFRLGEIEHLPLPDASVDVVISNCVLNLSPDKPQVWREIARVLKPGGRVALSDMGLVQALPEAALESIDALIGCVSGAELLSDTERHAREAGLDGIGVERKSAYVDELVAADDPLYVRLQSLLPEGTGIGDCVTSFLLAAQRPGGGCC
ncbi:MAG: arsenite methyltransferase [Planctomycetota bacterium]